MCGGCSRLGVIQSVVAVAGEGSYSVWWLWQVRGHTVYGGCSRLGVIQCVVAVIHEVILPFMKMIFGM